jgi:hypothetical protein
MNPIAIRLLSGAVGSLSSEPVITFAASNYNPQFNSYITISWNVTNAVSVSIDNGIGAVSAIGSTSVYGGSYELKTFTLTAIGSDSLSYTNSFSVRWSCNGTEWRGRCID